MPPEPTVYKIILRIIFMPLYLIGAILTFPIYLIEVGINLRTAKQYLIDNGDLWNPFRLT